MKVVPFPHGAITVPFAVTARSRRCGGSDEVPKSTAVAGVHGCPATGLLPHW
jgi:hypothetical protein